MAQCWDRQPGESAKAYAAFVEYLRLGVQRSQEQAAVNLRKSVGTLRRWAEGFGWVERAAEYDGFVAAQEREMALVVTRERAVVWAKRQEELKEAEHAMALRCLAKAEELLNRTDVRWSGGDIAKLLDVASKLGRLSTGMATDRRQEEVVGADGGPVQVQVDISSALRKVYGSELPAPGTSEGEVIDVREVREVHEVKGVRDAG